MPNPEHIRGAALWALALVLALALVWSAGSGAVDVSPAQIACMLLEPLGVTPWVELSELERGVFWAIRLPRVLMGALIGGALGVAGASLQGIFRNPLADPGLIGVSSGAALAVVGCIVFGGAFVGAHIEAVAPAAAFIGAMGATTLVLGLSSRGGVVDVATMLLAGVAVNALAGALIGFATYAASEAQLRSLTMWTLGSLSGATWSQVGIVSLISLPCVVWLLGRARVLDLLLLGASEAGHLGVDVPSARRWIVVACALSVGVGVGFTGMIGFVGLVVPHLMRLTGGAHHRWVLPGSALCGAALIVLTDLISRTALAPAELPIGVVTSLIGAPFFIWLLVGRRGW